MNNDWIIKYRGIDFGLERELRGFDLEIFSKDTRYSVNQLRDFEAGHYERLPGDVFVRGMVKMYVQKLGLDAGMVHLEYLYRIGKPGTDRNKTAEKQAGLKRFFAESYGVHVVVFVSVTLLLMLLLTPDKDGLTHGLVMPEVHRNQVQTVDWQQAEDHFDRWLRSGVTLSHHTVPVDQVPGIALEGEELYLTAVEATWIRVQSMISGIDSLTAFFPGESRTLSIQEETIIWFENPDAIRLREAASGRNLRSDSSAVIRFVPSGIHSIMSPVQTGKY